MKHTDRYVVAAIAKALPSLHIRPSDSTRGRRMGSRVRSFIGRRFRPAVLLLVLASLFLSSTPSAPSSFAGDSSDSGITASLPAIANRLATGLYKSLHDSYASTVNSLSLLKLKVRPANSSAFIPTPMLVVGAPTNLTVTAASNTSISLSWTSPGGAVDHYLVERGQSPQGPFSIIASPASTSHQDNTVSAGSAYLYRVRAVDSFGTASAPSTMAVGTAISFADATLVAGSTQIKKQHIYDLRQSVNAVRALAGLSAFTWTDSDLTGLQVKALHVQQLRDKLDEALTALSVPVTAYQDPTLATGANGTAIKKIHIEQLRLRSTAGISTSTGNVSSSGDSSMARTDPTSQTGGGGENPLSRNYNLNIPLLGLPGRAGLDLGLSLSYNSLVWTKNGSYISFDDDAGFPSAGFRLGFPVIQSPYYNSQVGKNAFLLIGSDGSRTELRQVNSSALYEAADSSHLLLDSTTMKLRTTDGTQLTYVWRGGQYQCTEIKDRNGNFITINYTAFDRIGTIVDTLGRVVTFNYDGTNYLTSISQLWNGQTHTWASFEYYPAAQIQTNFQGLTTLGPGSTIKAVSKVTLNDNSRFEFDYTAWGQIWKVTNRAAYGNVLNYRAYNLPGDQSPQTDCPRFTQRSDWAENWNRGGGTGASGLPAGSEQEVLVGSWTVPASASWTLPDGTPQTGTLAQVTKTDGTYDKIYYAGIAGTSTGWRRGLPSLVETYGKTTPDQSSPTIKQRSSVTSWTQDNENVSYLLNPRVQETNVYDFNASGQIQNRGRTRLTYLPVNIGDGTSVNLPEELFEYQANATTVLRRTTTSYIPLQSAYTNRRIIGLVSEKALYQVDASTQAETLMSKVSFGYDENSIQGNDAPEHHDNNYNSSFFNGRANRTSVKTYDVTPGSAAFTSSSMFYNTAGSIVKAVDPANHETQLSYVDQFSANGTTLDAARPSTLAYPTMVTDPEGYTVSSRYHYDFGALTWKQTPQPNTVTNLPGPEQTFTYDAFGRVQRTTNLVNGAYTRYVYPTSQNQVDTYATIQEGMGEAHSFTISDGYGRVFASASDHPGSAGGFSGQLVLLDKLGRASKSSNPTETSASGTPMQWTATGDDASVGWLYSQQTYDWKGRPLVTTHTDGTTKETNYSGCGCAGGAVAILTDEGTTVNGVPKKRQQKIYSDSLGRTVRTEVLNWDGAGTFGTGGSVYSSTVNTYNARDQVNLVRQFQGVAPSDPNDLSCPSGTCQLTTSTFDGYGRLKTNHVPEQDAGTATTYDYNPDNTIQTVTDARGASKHFIYNNRAMVKTVFYTAPSGITLIAPISFDYDGAGNRTSMIDATGSVSYQYDQLSKVISETRQFTDSIPFAPLPNNSFKISYEYNLAGNLKKLTAPYGEEFNYGMDLVGRLTGITGQWGYWSAGAQPYVSNISYRASQGAKSADFPKLNLDDNCFGGVKLTQTFDSRLRPASYEVKQKSGGFYCPGEYAILSKEYQYNPDNSVSLVKDPPIAPFDRSQEYDHAGRLTHVKTGVEARGQGAFGYYRQDFSYDTFGRTLTRQMNGPEGNETQIYTHQNNRTTSVVNGQQTPWVYDADGRVVNDTHTQYSYDAAGQVVGTHVPNEYFMARELDGDGNIVKQGVGETNAGVPLYFVRSSVLDEIITQLPASTSQDQVTFVYAFGRILARMTGGHSSYGNSFETVYLRFYDPGNSSFVDDDGGYAPHARMELDPAKAIVLGGGPSYPPSPNGGYLDTWTLGLEGLGGSPSGYGGSSCILDGFEANCGRVMKMIEFGMAAQCPQNNCGPRIVDGALRPIYLFEEGFGFYPLPKGSEMTDSKKKGSGKKGSGKNNGSSGKDVDFAVLESALKTCIHQLYPMYEMISFKAAQAGSSSGDDSNNGVIGIRDTQLGTDFKITSDTTPPKEVRAWLQQNHARGVVDAQKPWWTYSCPDCDTTPRPGEIRYPELFGAPTMNYGRVQIHETGAALTALRDIYHPGPWVRPPDGGLDPTHPDDGPAMEDCVGREYYRVMGLKPH